MYIVLAFLALVLPASFANRYEPPSQEVEMFLCKARVKMRRNDLMVPLLHFEWFHSTGTAIFAFLTPVFLHGL